MLFPTHTLAEYIYTLESGMNAREA